MSKTIRFGIFLWVQEANWSQLREAAIRAEAAGFDSLWISDHLVAPFPNPDVSVVEAWTTLAGIATVTTRMRFGLLAGNNLLRHPALVAKMAVTVDRMSNGRLTIGLGSGWLESEIRMHGLDFGTGSRDRIDRLEESIRVIRALGSGDEVDFAGAYYRLDHARHRPLALQGRLPILIGGNGRDRTLAVVARHADSWHASGDVRLLRELDEALVAHCVANQRDPASIERITHRWIRIRDDAIEAGAVLEGDLRRLQVVAPAPWLSVVGSPAAVADDLRPLIDSGFRHVLVALAAPFDHETIDRLPELRTHVERFA